jgi:glycyl-tRNA synthetase beta chain
MSALLFEIGCEELPAKMCESILRQLGTDEAGLVRSLLDEHRLLPADPRPGWLRVLVSPRRVAVLADGVPAQQAARVQTFRGPRADIAFGPDGQPTKAGAGFARSRGLTPQQLQRDVVDGTEFVTATVEAERHAAVDELPSFCAQLLGGIQVPRGMRWGARPAGAEEFLRFSRPIRWLVCKLDEQTVHFPFYDLQCGDVSQGHRVLGASTVMASAANYESQLEGESVIADQARRRQIIVSGLDDGARGLGGEWFDPGDVLAEAVYLVEWPSVLHGRFAEGKLRLPADVLITAMQSHQRYFPVRDADARLLPVFLYVGNADPAAAELITRGNERVLEGRLDDAEFAYDRDLAEGLPAMAGRLGSVVFHEKLGTLADKTARLRRLGAWLAGQAPGALAGAGSGALPGILDQAASLAKADLVSQVVIEFPALQGTMGGLYARAGGLPEAVAAAVGEHFLPLSAVAPVPSTVAAGLLAVADKADNIVGAWVAGEKPTGSRDPYGLRRAAMGIVRIALQYALRFDVSTLLAEALAAYQHQGLDVDATTVGSEARAFIWERLEGLLLDEGLPYDVVQAALGSTAADLPGTAARARAFAVLQERDFFVDVVTAYNRCAALATKAIAGASTEPSADLFRQDAERLLHDAWVTTAFPVADALGNNEIESALNAAAVLRPAVDRYFEDVLVMDDDAAVRANRLAQLAAVAGLLRAIGDFGRLEL